ncbi:MAG TPA: hypothetical protein VGT98_03875 [Candidatus Elarobacter sp.]|nr:hypothetical protein [Candidatus Elarobacter sp.]
MTLEVRYVTEHDLRGERGPALLRWLLDHGASEFSIAVMAIQATPAPIADAFEDALGPFERAPAPRRIVMSPTSMESRRVVRLWTFSSESLERLLAFIDHGLFHSAVSPDGWLEDLTVYRAGELVLGLVTHAREGVLRLTAEEHAAVAALGIGSAPAPESIGY